MKERYAVLSEMGGDPSPSRPRRGGRSAFGGFGSFHASIIASPRFGRGYAAGRVAWDVTHMGTEKPVAKGARSSFV